MSRAQLHGRPYATCHNGVNGDRCDECRAAYNMTRTNLRAMRTAMLANDPTIRTHGNISTYQYWGCRCAECRRVAKETRYKYPYKRRVSKGKRRYKSVPYGKPQPFGREWTE